MFTWFKDLFKPKNCVSTAQLRLIDVEVKFNQACSLFSPEQLVTNKQAISTVKGILNKLYYNLMEVKA